MATAVVEGSDEISEFICKPCERAKQYEEGVAYCVDCDECLCSTCFDCHKKSLVSRAHNMLDKTSIQQHGIPRKPPPLPPKPTKTKPPPTPSKPTKLGTSYSPFTQKCQDHNDEFTKLYCNDHDVLVCTVCLVKDHKQCNDVTYIPDVSGDVTQSTEFNQLFTELKRMRALLGFEHNGMVYNEIRIEDIHKKALDGITKFRKEMIQAIDQMYAAVEHEFNVLRDEQMAGLTAWSARYNWVQSKVDNTIQSIEKNMSNGNFNQLYVDMKLALANLDTMKQNVQRISDDNYVTQYIFAEKTEILDKLKAANGFGEILKKNRSTNVSAEFLHAVTAKSENGSDCTINAALALPDGDLALVDTINKSVKITDKSQKTVKTQLVLESKPFDIALVKEDQLVVTLPAVDKLQFLQLSNTELTMVRSVCTMDTSCFEIEYNDKTSELYALCSFGNYLVVMDMNGQIIKKIANDLLGRALFTKPRGLALSEDKNAVYVTENADNIVKLMNLSGEQIGEYRLPGRTTPLGIVSDIDGTVYISHGGSNAIYRLSSACAQPQTLLQLDEGLLRTPYAIALDRSKGLLYVGSASAQFRNKICVFQLKYGWA